MSFLIIHFSNHHSNQTLPRLMNVKWKTTNVVHITTVSILYLKLPEQAGELDRAAPPANECHVCGEDFKFLSVMDRWFEEKVILFSEQAHFQVFPLQTTLSWDGPAALPRHWSGQSWREGNSSQYLKSLIYAERNPGVLATPVHPNDRPDVRGSCRNWEP